MYSLHFLLVFIFLRLILKNSYVITCTNATTSNSSELLAASPSNIGHHEYYFGQPVAGHNQPPDLYNQRPLQDPSAQFGLDNNNGNFAGQPAHSDQQQLQIGSFYSLDEPAPANTLGVTSSSNNINQPNLLQLGGPQIVYPNNLIQQQQQQQQRQPQQHHQDRLNQIKLLQQRQFQRYQQMAQRPQPLHTQVAPNKQKLEVQSSPLGTANNFNFQQSIAKRPRAFVNLSSLLRPGEVILAQQQKVNDEPARPTNVSSVSVNEIEDLLQRLKPMAMGTGDKVATTQPTANLTPVGIKNQVEDQLNDVKEEHDDDDEAVADDNDSDDDKSDDQQEEKIISDSLSILSERPDQPGGPSRMAASNEHSAFLNTLASLGAQLNQPPGEPMGRRLYSAGQIRRPPLMPTRDTTARPTIPIEWLVDQLMSGSRQASFGVQHDDLIQPEQPALDEATGDEGALSTDSPLNEDYDDDYDEDEEDQSLPAPLTFDEDSLSGGESSSVRSRILPVQAKGGLNFSSVANRTDSWVPLGKLKHSLSEKLDKARQVGSASTTASKSTNKTEVGLGEKRQKKRGKKKNKKKKRRTGKRKKRQHEEAHMKRSRLNEDTGLMVGNKRLTRLELVRLIGIVNKLASKKEATKEREASRRLLRFLVKLALDNYHSHNRKKKRKKSTDEKINHKDNEKVELIREPDNENDGDPLKGSLRSLLMSPDLAATNKESFEEHKARKPNISIQLQPWRAKSFIENEEAKEPKEEPEEEQNSTQEDKSPPKIHKKSLADISEDLDKYFDGDFFEDLADKNKTAAKKGNSSEDIFDQQDPRREQVKPSKIRPYALPVPVFGQKQIDEADEDDVELDHVRVTPGLLKQQVEPKQSKARRRRNGRPDSARGKTDKQRRRRRRPPESRRVEEDPDEADEDEPPTKKLPESSKISARRTASPGRRHKPSSSQEDLDDNQEDLGDEKEYQEDKNEPEKRKKRLRKRRPPKKRTPTPTGRPIKQPNRSEKEPNGKKGRRRRHRRPGKRLRGAQKERELRRDEIPAPIVAGKTPAKNSDESKPEKGTLSASPANLTPKPSGSDKERQKVRKQAASKTRKMGELHKTPEMLARSKLKKVDKDEPASDEPVEGEKDADYYNEGTSYSGTCDDDGQCKVTLQSSNPKIEKALRQKNDQPTIVKHLDKWIRDEPD